MKNLAAILLFLFSIFSQSASSKNVLIVLSGVDHITDPQGKKHSSGFWLEEFSVPYETFKKAGLDITLATPQGNTPTMDASSAATDKEGQPLYFSSKEELAHALKIKKESIDHSEIKSLAKLLEEKQLDHFDAVFFPGGHAPMEDLVNSKEVGQLLKYFHEKGKTTALVCHAPAAILSTATVGNFLYKGYRVTSFTNTEEKGSELGKYLKITPENALKKAGAVFKRGSDWNSFIVEDRELITGQNPASSKAIAEAVLLKLK